MMELDNSQEMDYVADTDDSNNAIDTGNAIETQARSMGWVPLDEFGGDPEKWSEAEEYVERHEKHNGVLKKSNEALLKQIKDLESKVGSVEAQHQRMFDLQVKKMKEEHDNQIAFLKAQKRQARQAGDLDTADEIDEQIDILQEKGPDIPEPVTPAAKTQDPNAWRQNPILAEWADRNSWFEKDKAMTAYSVVLSQELRRDNPTMAFEDILNTVTVEVRKEFPHKFSSRRQSVEGAAVGGGAVTQTGGRRGYATLPADARQQCNIDVASGVFGNDETKARAQWAAMYYGYEDRRKK